MDSSPFTSYSAVVGQVLINLRTERDINQGQLAAGVGVSQSTWSRIEKGEVALSVDQLARAAKTLNVSPAAVLGWADQAVERIESDRKAKVLNDKPADVKAKSSNAGALLMGAGALAAIIWAARK